MGSFGRSHRSHGRVLSGVALMKPVLREHVGAVRGPLLIGFDVAIWCTALITTGYAYEAVADRSVAAFDLAAAGIVVLGLQLVIGSLVGQRHRRAPVGGREDLVLLAGVTATAGTWWVALNLLPLPIGVPASLSVAATAVALALAISLRLAWGAMRDRLVAHRVAAGAAERTLIAGSGHDARHVVRAMQRDVKARYEPVGFLAQAGFDVAAWHCKVPVLGTLDDLEAMIPATEATALVLACPGEPTARLVELRSAARAAGLRVLTLPGSEELDGEQLAVYHLREVDQQVLATVRSSRSIAPSLLHRMTGL